MGLDPGSPGSRTGLQAAQNRCATGVAPGPHFDFFYLFIHRDAEREREREREAETQAEGEAGSMQGA